MPEHPIFRAAHAMRKDIWFWLTVLLAAAALAASALSVDPEHRMRARREVHVRRPLLQHLPEEHIDLCGATARGAHLATHLRLRTREHGRSASSQSVTKSPARNVLGDLPRHLPRSFASNLLGDLPRHLPRSFSRVAAEIGSVGRRR